MTLTVRLLFESGNVMRATQPAALPAEVFRATVEGVAAELARLYPDDLPPLIEWEQT